MTKQKPPQDDPDESEHEIEALPEEPEPDDDNGEDSWTEEPEESDEPEPAA